MGYASEVDNSFFRYQNGSKAGDVWLSLTHLSGLDELEPAKTVFPSAFQKTVKLLQLGVSRRDDELSALLVVDAMFVAKADHFLQACNSELGFERSWFVIESGVEHAAVVRRLMLAHVVFLFDDRDFEIRRSFCESPRSRETDESGADHYDTIFFRRHL
jgi:hypothetical protein